MSNSHSKEEIKFEMTNTFKLKRKQWRRVQKLLFYKVTESDNIQNIILVPALVIKNKMSDIRTFGYGKQF